MEGKYTKGPWTWGRQEYLNMDVLFGADGSSVCDFGDDTQYYPTEGTPPNKADANLIAAAPELYEACLAMLGLLSGNGFDDSAMDIARNAIKKAEGAK